MKRVLIGILAILVIIALGFMLGPHPEPPSLEFSTVELPTDLQVLEQGILAKEAEQKHIKPGNASRIVWADTVPEKTTYVLLYLHGFSASPEEGRAMAEGFAQRYHCNLYLPRLQAHGLEETEPLLDFRADLVFASALEALAVAKQLGDKVILMGTSTGGTLALTLASQFPELAGLVLYSPNVKIFDSNASLITLPWGLQIARMVTGSDYRQFEASDYTRQYWTSRYRLEAVQQLQLLVETTMKPETFRAIRQPLFVGYYYRDETHQDNTISVPALLEMYAQVSTPPDQKREKAFPDANEHVISNPELSGSFEAVRDETYLFAEEILGLAPR